jgi:GNAT superfamily N-acetyltransferase
MIHIGKNTKSKIISKGISPDRGLVKMEKGAEGARNYTQCDSLLIGKKCGAHTVPYMEVKNPTAIVEHEATTSKISDDQMFYCRAARHQRGRRRVDDRRRLLQAGVSRAADGICGRGEEAAGSVAGRSGRLMTPRAHCDIAMWNGEVAGMALWFYNYSTFLGRAGIYLEDLFVRPAFRGHGIGKSLIAYLAQRCIDENLSRLQWSVLDWNAPSIAFYESLGADVMREWLACRMSRKAIDTLATSYSPVEASP